MIGVAVSIFPLAWVGLFSSDAGCSARLELPAHRGAVLPAARRGNRAYFASQGAGRVLRPILAGTVRLAIVIAGGLMVASLQGVFVVIAAAMIAFGALTVWFVASTDWK